MKKFFTSIITIFVAGFCLGQDNYIPFANENNYCINYYFFDTEPYPRPSNATLKFFKGDSIHNGKVYKKRYLSHLSGSHPCPPGHRPCFVADIPYKPIDKQYIGLFRDEISEKKVFFVASGSQEEGELFNFSLSKGDSISALLLSSFSNDYIGAGIIDSISFDTIENKVRKVLYFQAKSQYYPFYYFIQIIEGLGFSCDFCEGTLEQCNIVSSTQNESPKSQRQIQLIPNPAHDLVTFHLDNETSQQVNQYLIRDIHGKIVKDVSPVIVGKENTISTLGLPSGMYIVQFMKDGRIIRSDKIIVSH